jgi:hypothetical protein
MTDDEKHIIELEHALFDLMYNCDDYTDGCGCCSDESVKDTAEFAAGKALLGDYEEREKKANGIKL